MIMLVLVCNNVHSVQKMWANMEATVCNWDPLLAGWCNVNVRVGRGLHIQLQGRGLDDVHAQLQDKHVIALMPLATCVRWTKLLHTVIPQQPP